ncbi:MAG: hypothetical protein M3N17_09900 [Actinomycetota bacterium]|nr:hypothetical protein [Actinomycetota bacterium]
MASTREHASLQRGGRRRWSHPAGSLEWADTAPDRRRLLARGRRLRGWGFPPQWLSPRRARDVEPALTPPTPEAAEVAY